MKRNVLLCSVFLISSMLSIYEFANGKLNSFSASEKLSAVNQQSSRIDDQVNKQNNEQNDQGRVVSIVPDEEGHKIVLQSGKQFSTVYVPRSKNNEELIQAVYAAKKSGQILKIKKTLETKKNLQEPDLIDL